MHIQKQNCRLSRLCTFISLNVFFIFVYHYYNLAQSILCAKQPDESRHKYAFQKAAVFFLRCTVHKYMKLYDIFPNKHSISGFWDRKITHFSYEVLLTACDYKQQSLVTNGGFIIGTISQTQAQRHRHYWTVFSVFNQNQKPQNTCIIFWYFFNLIFSFYF